MSERQEPRSGADEPASGFARLGLDGRVEHVDDALAAFLGRPRDEVVGRSFAELIHAGDLESATARGEAAINGRPLAGPSERRFLRPDGSVAWGLVTTQLVRGPGGEPQHVTCHIVDVTAQRRAAERLRATNDEYRRLLEQGRDGVWVLDAGNLTASVTDGMAEMLGRSAEEMVGHPPQDFTDDEGRALADAALQRRRHGVRETYEMRWLHRDGHVVWGLVSASPVIGEGGAYAGAFALITDITERRRTEERLARHARQQEAIARVGRLALARLPMPELLAEAEACVTDVLGASESVVLLAEQLDAAGQGDIAVPVAGRREHGVIAVRWREGGDCGPGERTFLQSVANTLAAAIERDEDEQEMRRRALHDPLTGLPNRTLVVDRLAQALDRDARRHGTTAVILLDVDHFKVVNDSLGHDAGDQLLLAIAPRLVAAVRPGDTVGRLGGDEFVVLCEDVPDRDTAARVAGRLVDAFAEPFMLEGEVHHLSASVGIARTGEGGATPGELLRNADAAMYRAKERGRDRFELFDEELRERTVDRLRLERELREAVPAGQLALDWQPIVALDDGSVVGLEALVRWHHPQRGIVPPGRFVPIAEDAGLITEIGNWVLRTACREGAAWRSGGRALSLHVNLSPRQVADPRLPQVVEEALAGAGLDPAMLVLEITETSLMEAGPAPLEVLTQLTELGVRLVLDDFGTGWSSLSRLRHFPIDGLKVDRSFVAELDGDDRAGGLIVAGVVEMARALALTSVAEGIETPAQADLLRRLGCRYGQGFLFARPMPASAVEALLAGARPLPDAA